MKRFIKCCILLFILLVPLSSFGYDNEPDGFRGIKWGTDISELKDMNTYGGKLSNDAQLYALYTRQNDELQIGEAKLERIEYRFWDNKLSSVMIITKGYANWTALRDTAFTKFGKGYQSNQFIKDYHWNGDITYLSLKYNEIEEKGTLFLLSTKLAEQERIYKQRKAKEGAEKGF